MARDDKRLKRKVRNSYLISTVSIAMVLFLLGSATYLILNALNASNRLRESVEMHVMLRDTASEGQIEALQKQIAAKESVREVRFLSKEEAAAQFKAEMNEDFEAFLEYNPLPNSFAVALKSDAADKETLHALEQELSGLAGVREVVYQKGVVEQIGTNLGKFNLIVMVFGAVLLLISVILLNNTIRMTVAAKSRIINTMKLVGATKGFIMKPFAGRAVLHGFLAAVIAIVMFAALLTGLKEGIPEITLLTGNIMLAAICGGMVALGIIISLLFTLFAVNKFVNMPTGKIYLY